MSSYPKWLYHPTKEAVVVPDETAHKALGPDWVTSPADVKKHIEPPKKAFTPLVDEEPEAALEKHKRK